MIAELVVEVHGGEHGEVGTFLPNRIEINGRMWNNEKGHQESKLDILWTAPIKIIHVNEFFALEIEILQRIPPFSERSTCRLCRQYRRLSDVSYAYYRFARIWPMVVKLYTYFCNPVTDDVTAFMSKISTNIWCTNIISHLIVLQNILIHTQLS